MDALNGEKHGSFSLRSHRSRWETNHKRKTTNHVMTACGRRLTTLSLSHLQVLRFHRGGSI
jgi:hypothetical protein